MASGAAPTMRRMLREVKDAGFVPHGMWFWRRYVFEAGRHRAAAGIRRAALAEAATAQASQAVCVLEADARRYWWCGDRFWWEDDDLDAADVFALVYERSVRRQRRLERAHAVVAADAVAPRPRREAIPREVRRAVWERDGGRCAECEADFDIQFDHVIPLARGGANTVANLQLLCAPCNQSKGAAL